MNKERSTSSLQIPELLLLSAAGELKEHMVAATSNSASSVKRKPILLRHHWKVTAAYLPYNLNDLKIRNN